ncbi:MAG: hypothetical protein HKN88_08590 [Gammaproteobacteria bacterium]|nr:pirin family protein [Gammaproteobacteria bacterium]NNC98116.1 hypothetical protein [Gammaproteobacteria bacterium]NNM13180.1 hypothetical protein [Gammaproteobacteria bacterium]
MLAILPGTERGQSDSDHHTSLHSFSFGTYLNHTRMGYSVLQALNAVSVKPGVSLGEKSHVNMEILTYVTQGELVHTDSLGTEQIVPAGDFQLMASGAGIEHSESNGSETEMLEFLEMWIIPNQINIRPGYQQRSIEPSSNFQLVASHMPRDEAMFLNQESEIYRFHLDQNRYFYLARAADHHKAYVHVIRGKLDLCDGDSTISISAGDGVMCSDITRLEFIKTDDAIAEGMLFVLPGFY